MPIERTNLQLPVVTSGCTLVHQKVGQNIFPMRLVKSGSGDQKLQFSALNCRGNVGFVVTMPIERANLQLPVVPSGCKLVHQEVDQNIFPMSLVKTGSDDQKIQFSA